tara:strand:- start:47 stop:382 length:336 start_codon:yes stop_codon:yes gene_type:complete
MNKYFLINDAADDTAMYPVEALRAVTCAADATVLVQFNAGLTDPTGATADVDTVTLTITSDKQLEVMKEIARAANATGPQYNDGVIVLCDDVNSVFLHEDILSCTITLNTI